MAKPTASKRTAVNLITNGDFSAGNSGWASSAGGTVRVENGLLLLSAGGHESAVQTVTGLTANENYKLTFSYRVRRKGDNDGYVSVNGTTIDSLETVSEGEEFVKSADHLVTGVTKVDLLFITANRAVTIDDVVLEASNGVSHLTVSAETVEHNEEILCTLYAYTPAGAPLADAQVIWGSTSSSMKINPLNERTDDQGKSTCIVSNNARPEEEGQGHITALIVGAGITLKTPYLTFKLPKK